jgi:uncharacterized membrane protein YcaP (DUF421 family)
MEFINNILGLEADKLNTIQMSVRALVVFFAGIILVRIAGIKTFGKKTIFNHVTALIVGTLLGNAIFNADVPFFPLLGATLFFMILNRIAMMITYYSQAAGRLMKGSPILLIKKGKLLPQNMKKLFITKADIDEELRLEGDGKIENIEEACLERSGDMSFIKKEE